MMFTVNALAYRRAHRSSARSPYGWVTFSTMPVTVPKSYFLAVTIWARD